eukprot:31336-Pelagococcus_subviridis.AAC.11
MKQRNARSNEKNRHVVAQPTGRSGNLLTDGAASSTSPTPSSPAMSSGNTLLSGPRPYPTKSIESPRASTTHHGPFRPGVASIGDSITT